MVIMKKLPTQLRCGPKPLVSEFVQARNYESGARKTGFMKPVGGMWTSTYDTAFEEGWPAWCIGENFHLEHLNEAYLLEPVECRVIELAGFDQCHAFMARYGRQLHSLPSSADRWFMEPGADPERVYARAYEHFDTPSMACPVWEDVMADADCVRLLTPYAMNVRLGPYLCFNGWDCESTVWLRWKFEGQATKVDLSSQIKRHKLAV
jgi:hypothetical protein